MRVGSRLLSPEDLVDRLPSRPLLTMAHSGCRGLTLQRFQHPPSIIDVPALRDELLVDHLAGPVLVEEDYGTGNLERRWTGPGQVTLTPTGQPVRRILKGRPDVVLLHLAPELLQAVAQEMYGKKSDPARLLHRFAEPDPRADQLVRLLLAEAETPGPSSSLMTESLGQALVIHLLRYHSNLAEAPSRQMAPDPAPRVRRVIDQMRLRLDQELPLSRLAEMMGVSRSQFVRAFRHATGVPPHQFLRGLRIEKAQKLLEQTDLPVIEVALNCGFGQPGHFATAFREATGMSPRVWRQARRS